MIVTITGPIVHRCPFVEELDVGTFDLTYDSANGLIELHALAKHVEAFADQAVTHETLTADLASIYEAEKATVVTRWRTAGLDVECRAP